MAEAAVALNLHLFYCPLRCAVPYLYDYLDGGIDLDEARLRHLLPQLCVCVIHGLHWTGIRVFPGRVRLCQAGIARQKLAFCTILAL